MIDLYAEQSDKFIGTAAAIAMALSAAASAGGAVYAANKSSDTATKAGELQAKGASDQLAFAKTQAAQDQANWESAQKFNIDQYNQKQSRLAPYIGAGSWANTTLANMIGGSGAVAATKTPAPVATLPPMQGPLSNGTSGGNASASPTGAGGSATDSTAAASGDPVTQALLDNYKSLGVQPTGPGSGPTDIAYYAKQIAATGGLAPDNAKYWFGPNGRIASDLSKANGGGTSAGGSATATPAAAGVQTPSLPMNFADQSSPVTLSSLVRTPALAPAAPVTLSNFWQPTRNAQYA